MSYLVKAVFDDASSIDVIVPQDEIEQVHDCLKKEHLSVFNEKTRVGIWSPLDKLRCVMIQPYVARVEEELKEQEPEKADDSE